MTQKQKNLIGGVSLLGIAGLIGKIIGVLFRIPLAQSIGGTGMALYSQVYQVYNLMLTVSSAGIPVAISRMVAHCLAQNDPLNARRVFRVSLVLLTVLGGVATVLMMALSGALAAGAGTPDAYLSYLAIAPSLFFVCVMSAFRGSMQGRRRMAPTAISQLIEQIGKVFIALPIANYMMALGQTPSEQFAFGAAGAMLGISIAEALALLYMGVRHLFGRQELRSIVQDESKEPLSAYYLAKYILRIAVPITVGACIVPLAGFIDAFMLVNIMVGYLPEAAATINYGVYTGLVLPLINIPTAIAMAISANLVPSISAAVARDNQSLIHKESLSGLRLSSLIGLPCSVGMSMLAEPLIFCLFSSGGKFSDAELHLGAQLLIFSALTIFFFIQVQATSGILQGLRKQRIPMYTLVAGVAAKVVLNYSLVNIPAVNIHGAPFASLLCYTVSLLPNLYFIRKYTGLHLSVKELLIKPGLATALMAGAVWALSALIGPRLNHSFSLLLLVILAAMIVYFIAAALFGALKKEDVPGKLKKFLPR